MQQNEKQQLMATAKALNRLAGFDAALRKCRDDIGRFEHHCNKRGISPVSQILMMMRAVTESQESRGTCKQIILGMLQKNTEMTVSTIQRDTGFSALQVRNSLKELVANGLIVTRRHDGTTNTIFYALSAGGKAITGAEQVMTPKDNQTVQEAIKTTVEILGPYSENPEALAIQLQTGVTSGASEAFARFMLYVQSEIEEVIQDNW